jgi:hypothetical protein
VKRRRTEMENGMAYWPMSAAWAHLVDDDAALRCPACDDGDQRIERVFVRSQGSTETRAGEIEITDTGGRCELHICFAGACGHSWGLIFHGDEGGDLFVTWLKSGVMFKGITLNTGTDHSGMPVQ